MTKQTYMAPALERIGSFHEATNGYPWWDHRDVFGGRTFVAPW